MSDVSRSSLPPSELLIDAPFVGREDELRALHAALDRALAGAGQLVLLVGEPGIGKTRTSERLASSARERGALVLWGSCYEWDGAPAYWPWTQALRTWLHHGDAEVRPALPADDLAILMRVIPEIASETSGIVAPAPLDSNAHLFRLLTATGALIRNAATHQPLLIVLDDVLWADTPSLQLLRFLAQEIRDARVLSVATCRGGGGNFGVVTSFLFRLHPVDSVYAGPMLWHMNQAEEVLRWYRDFLPNLPDQLNGFFAFLRVPAGPPFPEHLWNELMCGVVWCYGGPFSDAETVFAPIRRLCGGPALDFVGPLPHTALQSMFDPIYPPGLQWYWKADFINEISDAAIERHIVYGRKLPTAQSTMHLYPIDGVAGRVGRDATAWSYRDAKWAAVIVGVSPDPADRDRITTWARDY